MSDELDRLRRSPYFLRVATPEKPRPPRERRPHAPFARHSPAWDQANARKEAALFAERPHLALLRAAAVEAGLPVHALKKPDRTFFTTRLHFNGQDCEVRHTSRPIEKHNVFTERTGTYCRFELKAPRVKLVEAHLFLVNIAEPDVLRTYLIPSTDLYDRVFGRSASGEAELLIRIDAPSDFDRYLLDLPLTREPPLDT